MKIHPGIKIAPGIDELGFVVLDGCGRYLMRKLGKAAYWTEDPQAAMFDLRYERFTRMKEIRGATHMAMVFRHITTDRKGKIRVHGIRVCEMKPIAWIDGVMVKVA